VGATDIDDKIAPFSNWGRKVDIFAPGVGIESAWITDPDVPETNQETETIQGTSMGE
jgi:subtilisin family serine protease